MLSKRGTCILPGSFNAPVLPPPDATFAGQRPAGSPAWVMLDEAANIGHKKNATFAQTITRTGKAVGVSLWLTDPPAVSHLCFHLSGLKVTDLIGEPRVACLGKDIAIIRVVYNLGVRPLESVHDMGMSNCDYLVYKVHNDPPSLDVLPDPKPLVFHPFEIGFLPCGDGGEDFLMAVLRPKSVHLQYQLHTFSSKENTWTTRLVLLEPTYPGYKQDDYLVHESNTVITLEGGLLGWVDLWRGILLCNVLDTNPVVRYIQFPKPMGGNMCQYLRISGGAVRDATFSDGIIKLIEMEDKKRLYAAARVSNGPLNRAVMLDSGLEVEPTESYTPDGWTTVTWNRKLSWDRWRQDCTAYVSASSILPQLRHNHSESSAPKDLKMAGPLWSMHDEDVVYLMAKAKTKDKHAWAIGFNIRKSTLDGVTSFPEERQFSFKLAYRPFILSKYLNMASYNSRAAPVSWIPEREDSNNEPEGEMVLVEGLDTCVTVNQLKGIVAMFGELCYLKIHADERYGLVKFASRFVHKFASRILTMNQKVLVEGLDPYVTVNQLKGIVAMFGELCYLKIHADERYGLVKFASRLCAEQAISALNGAQIGSKSVRLSWRPSNVNKKPPRRRLIQLNRATYHPYAHRYGVRSCNSSAARGNYAHEVPKQ